MHFFLISIFS